ncbi:chaplin [Streptomyces sp. N2-109]|uniref:Chaplin n=1 Tax=Streptomyces gossypii TaxID=2883101 RepID=A0ABT2K4N9_9ACTN|nr:chaplin [Streptomyces gossypii]MCT2594843.1 chaplin [Streptomyces gossypii]
MKNIKRIAAITMTAGGLVIAGAGAASATVTPGGGAHAAGVAAHSPGVLSGNVVQAPIHVPLNVCGNSVSVIGLLNPTFGNTCVNA